MMSHNHSRLLTFANEIWLSPCEALADAIVLYTPRNQDQICVKDFHEEYREQSKGVFSVCSRLEKAQICDWMQKR